MPVIHGVPRAFHLFILGDYMWEATLSPMSRNILNRLKLRYGIGVGDASYSLCSVKQ